jgi:hypothetical protein
MRRCFTLAQVICLSQYSASSSFIFYPHSLHASCVVLIMTAIAELDVQTMIDEIISHHVMVDAPWDRIACAVNAAMEALAAREAKKKFVEEVTTQATQAAQAAATVRRIVLLSNCCLTNTTCTNCCLTPQEYNPRVSTEVERHEHADPKIMVHYITCVQHR